MNGARGNAQTGKTCALHAEHAHKPNSLPRGTHEGLSEPEVANTTNASGVVLPVADKVPSFSLKLCKAASRTACCEAQGHEEANLKWKAPSWEQRYLPSTDTNGYSKRLNCRRENLHSLSSGCSKPLLTLARRKAFEERQLPLAWEWLLCPPISPLLPVTSRRSNSLRSHVSWHRS